VIRIVDQLGSLIDKDGPGFIEAHAVLFCVDDGRLFIPLESKRAHAGSVTTL
jgi:hypothetical protein